MITTTMTAMGTTATATLCLLVAEAASWFCVLFICNVPSGGGGGGKSSRKLCGAGGDNGTAETTGGDESPAGNGTHVCTATCARQCLPCMAWAASTCACACHRYGPAELWLPFQFCRVPRDYRVCLYHVLAQRKCCWLRRTGAPAEGFAALVSLTGPVSMGAGAPHTAGALGPGAALLSVETTIGRCSIADTEDSASAAAAC